MLPLHEQQPATLELAYARARMAARTYASRVVTKKTLFVVPGAAPPVPLGPPAGFFARWKFELTDADFTTLMHDVGTLLHAGSYVRQAVSAFVPLQQMYIVGGTTLLTAMATLRFLENLLPGRRLRQPAAGQPAGPWTLQAFMATDWYSLMHDVQAALASGTPQTTVTAGSPQAEAARQASRLCPNFSDEEDDDADSILKIKDEEWQAHATGGPLAECTRLVAAGDGDKLVDYLFALDFTAAPVQLRTFLWACVRKLAVPKRAHATAVADPVYGVLVAIKNVRALVCRCVCSSLLAREFDACPFLPAHRARLWGLLRRLDSALWGSALPMFGRSEITRAKPVHELSLAELGMALSDMTQLLACLWKSLLCPEDPPRIQRLAFEFPYQLPAEVNMLRLNVFAPLFDNVFSRPLRRLENSSVDVPVRRTSSLPPVEQAITLGSLIRVDDFHRAAPKQYAWLEHSKAAHAGGLPLSGMAGYALSVATKRARSRSSNSLAPASDHTDGKPIRSAPRRVSVQADEVEAKTRAAAQKQAAANLASAKQFMLATEKSVESLKSATAEVKTIVSESRGGARTRRRSRTRSRSRSRDRPRRRRARTRSRSRSRSKGRGRGRSRDRSPRGARAQSPLTLGHNMPMRTFKTEWAKWLPTVVTAVSPPVDGAATRIACPYAILTDECNMPEFGGCAFCHDIQQPERPAEADTIKFLQGLCKQHGVLPGSITAKLKPQYARALDPRALSNKKGNPRPRFRPR